MAGNVSSAFSGLIPRGLETQIRDIKVRTDRVHEMANGNNDRVNKMLAEFEDLRARVRDLEEEVIRRRGGRPPKVA